MRRFFFWALTLFMAAALCGCSPSVKLTFDPQDLYSLPELPPKYTALNDQLSEILRLGAEYSAPVSGTNIQPVQLQDLNGDGREDAVAFFRNTADEKPLKICVFTAEGEDYEQTALIEGSGTAIYSVTYTDLDHDGRTELVVSWRVSTELQVLAIYALRPEGPTELLRTDYVKYALVDLDENQMQELMVLRAGPDGESVAEYYDWQDGVLTARAPSRISMTMAELSQQGRMTRGVLRGGEPALFITGVAESAQAITDILALRNGELSNIVLSAATGVSGETAVFRSLYPMDINGDGLTEVPKPESLPLWEGSSELYQVVVWNSYDQRGKAEAALSTYHDVEDGWFLRLPESWRDRILVSRTVTGEEAVVTFYIRSKRAEGPEPFLRIAAITGANRENRALRGSRFMLVRKAERLYTAELLEANGAWDYRLSEDEIRSAFSLIATEWTENEG